MNKKIIQMKNGFDTCGNIPIFEIQVITKQTNNVNYITFDISILKNSFIAIHESLTIKEKKSKKIAYKKLVIDTYSSLDENLQALYEVCINAILESEFYELSENN